MTNSKPNQARLTTYWPLWALLVAWLGFSIYFIITMPVGSHKAESSANTRVLDKADATKEICRPDSGYTHEQCADVQARYNTEFLCSADGKSCWVEVK